jgi:hypothetical protein
VRAEAPIKCGKKVFKTARRYRSTNGSSSLIITNARRVLSSVRSYRAVTERRLDSSHDGPDCGWRGRFVEMTLVSSASLMGRRPERPAIPQRCRQA